MVDPEGFFRLLSADQRRRDIAIERNRAHLPALEPDPALRLTLTPPATEPAADQEVA